MDPLYDYFLVPLMRNGWFNPVNSIVYGAVLVVGIWAVFNLLKKTRVPVDRGFFIAVLPFVAFAGVTRTLRDYIYFTAAGNPGFLSSFTAYMQAMQQAAYTYVLSATGNSTLAFVDSYVIAWFPTPGSYAITFMLALFSLFVGLVMREFWGTECWKTMTILGMIFFLANAAIVPVSSFTPLAYIGTVALGWAALFFALGTKRASVLLGSVDKRLSGAVRKMFTPLNSTILSAHMFDATATFFAIALFTTIGGQGYTEQHFLSRGLMPFIGPQVMFLLKLVVVIPVLYIIDTYSDNKQMTRFLKLAVFILGIAPAARNLVRLMVGV